MTLVVLAAGMGSRYGGLKQLDPITPHGELIIDFSVFDAIRAGYDRVVFIIKRENYDAFRTTIGKRIESVIHVDYAFQEMPEEYKTCFPAERTKPLGTAQALLCAQPYVKGPFAVINADDFYGASAYRLAAEYLRSVQGERVRRFCMVGYRLGNTLTENGTVSRGICQADADGYLQSIIERTKIRREGDGAAYLEGESWIPLSSDSIASMNFFGFDDTFFQDLSCAFDAFAKDKAGDRMKCECFLPTVAGQAAAAGSCTMKVLHSEDCWFGVTYHEDKEFVKDSIKTLIGQGIYPDGLWK